jgi:hypothetical protein
VKGICTGAINLHDGGAADIVSEGHGKSGWQISGKLPGRKVKMSKLEIVYLPPGDLTPSDRNARKHSAWTS